MAGTPSEDVDHLDTSRLPTEDDDSAPAILAESGGGQDSKVKTILGLLKKLIGVSDVANLRLSLPASLLEPIPNLEYWQYADRPDIFASVGNSTDELERMLSVLRYSFSKELHFVRYKIGKPYNSTLGEHFRCHWSLPLVSFDPKTKAPIIKVHKFDPAVSGAGELGSMSEMSTPVMSAVDTRDDVSVRSLGPATPPTKPTFPSISKKSTLGRQKSNLSTKSTAKETDLDGLKGLSITDEKVDVVYLTEQVSHHPPISSAYYTCPSRGVEMSCVDQISAKVSFPAVQITPGSANQGLFINLSEPSPGAGEEYQITHPIAQVNGIMRGTYYGTISDKVVITCKSKKSGTRLKAVTEFKDESWLGKPKFAVEGVIASYDPSKPEEADWSKVKQVPADRVVAQYEGSWKKQVKWRRKGEKEWRILIDLDELDVVPKNVRPLDEQSEHESRNLWNTVTEHMLAKNWGEATKEKQVIEQKQRDLASELKRKGEEHNPVFFLPDISTGRPQLSEAGKRAVQEELERAKKNSS